MPLVLPRELGTPAGDEPSAERFVSTPVLATSDKQELNEMLEQASRGKLPNIGEARKLLMRGLVPRSAGRAILSRRILDAFDLQALVATPDGPAVAPQGKEAVDHDTRQPRDQGLVIFSRLRILDGVVKYESRLVGLVVNPDLDPWLADDLGVSSTWKQNDYGQLFVAVPAMEVISSGEGSALDKSGRILLPKIIR